VKVILYRDKYLPLDSWKDINTAEYRKLRILIYDLIETEAWLTDRDLTLNMENVRHKDADGHWIVTTFWADLTPEQAVEFKLTFD